MALHINTGDLSNSLGVGRIKKDPYAGYTWDEQTQEFVSPTGERVKPSDDTPTGEHGIYKPVTGFARFFNPQNAQYVDKANAEFLARPTIANQANNIERQIAGRNFGTIQDFENSGGDVSNRATLPYKVGGLLYPNLSAEGIASGQQSTNDIVSGNPQLASKLRGTIASNQLREQGMFGSLYGPENTGTANAAEASVSSGLAQTKVGELGRLRDTLSNTIGNLNFRERNITPLQQRGELADAGYNTGMSENRFGNLPIYTDMQTDQAVAGGNEAAINRALSYTNRQDVGMNQQTAHNQNVAGNVASQYNPALQQIGSEPFPLVVQGNQVHRDLTRVNPLYARPETLAMAGMANTGKPNAVAMGSGFGLPMAPIIDATTYNPNRPTLAPTRQPSGGYSQPMVSAPTATQAADKTAATETKPPTTGQKLLGRLAPAGRSTLATRAETLNKTMAIAAQHANQARIQELTAILTNPPKSQRGAPIYTPTELNKMANELDELLGEK